MHCFMTIQKRVCQIQKLFLKIQYSIPIYPSLTKIQQKIIIDEVKRLINEN